MEEQVRILCVDDETNVLRSLERIFIDDDFEIYTASSGDEGLKLLAEGPTVQVIISDYRMPGMNGVDFLKKVCGQWPDTVRIVLSGYADTAAVVAAINEGQIYKFIPKPWNDDELRMNIVKAVETYFLNKKNLLLSEELSHKNQELKQMNENLEKLVGERTSALILQNRALVHAQNILQCLPVGVIGVVPDGVLVQCNDAAARLLGREKEALLGEKTSAVLPEELCGFIDRVLVDNFVSEVLFLQGTAMRTKGIHIHNDNQEGVVVVFDREESP